MTHWVVEFLNDTVEAEFDSFPAEVKAGTGSVKFDSSEIVEKKFKIVESTPSGHISDMRRLCHGTF